MKDDGETPCSKPFSLSNLLNCNLAFPDTFPCFEMAIADFISNTKFSLVISLISSESISQFSPKRILVFSTFSPLLTSERFLVSSFNFTLTINLSNTLGQPTSLLSKCGYAAKTTSALNPASFSSDARRMAFSPSVPPLLDQTSLGVRNL